MRELKIKTTPFEFIDLLDVRINKWVNEHGTATVIGRIPEELEDKYVEMAGSNEWFTIIAEDEYGNEKVIFNGVVRSVSIKTYKNVRTLQVEAITGSYVMDIYPKKRTFQNENQTYRSVLSTLEKSYPKGEIYMRVGENDTTKTILVQYQETDWQFAKRLASHFNSVLVPEFVSQGEKFYFGMPSNGKLEEVDFLSYTLKKDVSEYIYKTKNKVKDISENDCIYYIVQSREILDLCQPVKFKGRDLYVHQIESKLEGHELMHYYSFKSEQGFKTKKEHNEKLIGASISANVLDVSGDKVKVQMSVDGEQKADEAKWFPYSTVYSSPDGTGWYCMPEAGDTMRVYFSDEEENNAFVISAVHEQSQEGKRSDPNIKILSTKYGKEIIFSEKGLEIKSGDGMSIKLLDEEGIIIECDKNVKIDATEDINLISDQTISFDALEGIELIQGENDATKIELKEDITFMGGQVKMMK